MSYPEEPEYGDRPADRSGRPGRAARPAWDAATYGRPDDTRRRGRSAAKADHPAELKTDDNIASTVSYPESGGNASTGFYVGDLYPATADPAQESWSTADRYRGGEAEPYSYLAVEEYPAADSPAGYPESDVLSASRGYGSDRHGSDLGWTEPPAAVPIDVADDDRYLGGLDPGVDESPEPPAERRSRAGRNLPAAIGVGVVLAAVVLASLFLWRPAFLAVVAVAVGVGVWELVRAIRTSGANPPLVPLVAGGALMAGLAWWGQVDGLTFGLVVTVLAAMAWRLADGPGGYGRDISAAALVAVYVPFLAGFAVLLASSDDGHLRVLVTLAGVVLSDTGGYVAGVLFGRHPMAPSVSPKKSWEGLAGSLVATGVGGALLLYFLFDVAPWWGVLFGLAVSVASVLGDLGESMIKRDLGVKDMSTLLPGHGGLMDRLDSVVFAAPTAYSLLVLLAPPL